MAIPTIISQVINLIYSIADTYFIGRTGNTDMMSSVTVSFTLFMMTIAFANLFGVGGGSLIARLSGKHDTENARKVCVFAVCGAAGIALLYTALIGAFAQPILYAFGASQNTIGYAKQYVYLVVVAGSFPTIMSMCLAHLLRNTGYSKYASIGLSGGGLLNIALDPLFMFVIFPKGYEVFGAALATLISNIASFIFLYFAMLHLSKSSPLCLKLKEMRGIRREDIKELFAVGIPSAVLTGLFDVANIVLNKCMSFYGDEAVAALGIVMKAERLPNALNIGICQGMLPIVAYNYSSGNRERMNKTIKLARNAGLIIAAISLILFEIFAKPIVNIFMSTSQGNIEQSLITIGLATTFLRWRCTASPIQLINYHSSFCMQAMGDGKRTLIHAIGRIIVLYIPLTFLLDAILKETGLALSLTAGEFFGAILALVLLRQCINKASKKYSIKK